MDSSPLLNRFYSSEETSSPVCDLNKKRKLLEYELENSGLPWPRHKIRDRRGIIHTGLLNSENPGKEDGSESENDSNSFIGGSDNKMAPEGDSDTDGLSEINHEELENLEMAELEDAITDDTMLYSNDTPPFLLASGKWSLGQDARLGTRKPTIDQEFEQYFSALML